MKAHLTRRYRFSASHRLHSAEMSAEENLATYGKCNNPHGHGHNYTLEVTVSGPVDRPRAWSAIWSISTASSKGKCSPATPANLNTLQEFAQLVPTTENLSIEIFEILQRGFPQAHLERVRLEETMMNSFEYAGAAEPRR